MSNPIALMAEWMHAVKVLFRAAKERPRQLEAVLVRVEDHDGLSGWAAMRRCVELLDNREGQ